MKVCFNGDFGEEGDFTSVISPFSDSVQFGQAVFETLRTYDGDRVFVVEEHLDRLFESARILKLNFKETVYAQNLSVSPVVEPALFIKGSENLLREKIFTCLQELVDKNKIPGKDLRIKIFLAEDFFWIRSQVLDEMSDEFYDQGVVVDDMIFERTFPRAKWINPAYPYFQKIRPEGIFETICFTEAGFLREGTISNVFMVSDGVVTTPEKNILLGVTRQKVIETAERLGYKTEEREIGQEELQSADEIFLTCTSKEVIPVRQWGDWQSQGFCIAKKLRERFPRGF